MGETTKEESADKAPKARGVGDVAMEAIRARNSNEEALAAVQAELPEAKTSAASINWYRNKLRSDGEDVPTSRELKKEAKAAAAKAEADKAPKKDPLE